MASAENSNDVGKLTIDDDLRKWLQATRPQLSLFKHNCVLLWRTTDRAETVIGSRPKSYGRRVRNSFVPFDRRLEIRDD